MSEHQGKPEEQDPITDALCRLVCEIRSESGGAMSEADEARVRRIRALLARVRAEELSGVEERELGFYGSRMILDLDAGRHRGGSPT